MRYLVPADVEVLPARLVNAEVIALIVIADIVGPEVYGKAAVFGAGFNPKYVKEDPRGTLPYSSILALLSVVFGVSQNGSVGILPKPLGGFSIKIFPPASIYPAQTTSELSRP